MKKASTTKNDIAEKANAPFPTRLRALMEREQMKQGDLAELLKVTRQSANQYCLGLAFPDVEKLCKIALHFSVTIDYLLGLSNISSTIEDIKAVCKTTHLTEKAISHISDPYFALEETLLFESPQWGNFISQFGDYLFDFISVSSKSDLDISRFELTHVFWTLLESLNLQEVDQLYKQRETQRNATHQELNAICEISEIKKLYNKFCQDNGIEISVSDFCKMIEKNIK